MIFHTSRPSSVYHNLTYIYVFPPEKSPCPNAMRGLICFQLPVGYTVIPRLTNIIRFGITFVRLNLCYPKRAPGMARLFMFAALC